MTNPDAHSGASARHFVIIGNGVAGNQAAETLRDRDPDCRITILTNSRLLFYNRYLLPRIFLGQEDWQSMLAHPAAHYAQRRIQVRRDCWVTHIDAARRLIHLRHQETVRYDTLLVATGGRGHLPEELADCRSLLHGFGSYEQAMQVKRALPDGGTVVLLGGDMIGLDLARVLLQARYRVVMVAGEFTFWPHQPPAEQRPRLLAAVANLGIEVIDGEARGRVIAVESAPPGLPARRLRFADGGDLYGDVVLGCMGLTPAIDFMLGSGADIERGLLVNTALCTSDPHIFAAGDVCQIWTPEEHRYRFYYGYRNVRAMGAVAAANMTGGEEPFVSTLDETLRCDDQGQLASPFWEYE